MLQLFDANRNMALATVTKHIGNTKAIDEFRMYLRNTDPARYYERIRIYPTPHGYNELARLSREGWTAKLLPGDRRPTEAEWAAAPNLPEFIELGNIGTIERGDTSTSKAFWVRVVSPMNVPSGLYDLVALRWSAIQGTVNGQSE